MQLGAQKIKFGVRSLPVEIWSILKSFSIEVDGGMERGSKGNEGGLEGTEGWLEGIQEGLEGSKEGLKEREGA